ncbi:MAG: hypothetical protein PHR35_22560, partial [Kiritimatiellae bacterium]|nr:hypothetical protein [Kiritimatiellia bacterium]
AYVNRGVCEVVWREASSEAPWRPLDAAGRFPLRQLATNGVYRIAFAACEEKTQYDLSPVTMTIRLALDDQGLLLMTLDRLVSDDPAERRVAERRLYENRERWTPLLHQLQRQSQEAAERLEALRCLDDALR